ncbi:replication fork protection component swi3 domain-containing protein [Hirsutella rhossiliensis]|uniref:Chromosome segregation in meiosis protein n=1 Tax=Hirsutella rhossiliensis TaxID=111463 RepID=A0A9P8MR37_9HYPO|nr:replication fork protection component swi3 domain-containing protein [Hirsutella rhossiliensis]KAH0958934.1 replication fork protection component swi3 domain-containing protein [Hirsutella rhossiliensis]
MPSAATTNAPPPRHDDLDNYGVDAPLFSDDDDDPFASPPPTTTKSRKRTEADAGLGIDEQVEVQKRARVPNVKLDEDRLLGPAGVPKLRERARNLRLKGKGHEFSDASRLLSLYQLWLDDLFPKARFLDALVMVEKTGHKKRVMAARKDWIDEGKPKPAENDRDEEEEEVANEDARNPLQESTGGPAESSPRPRTPAPDPGVPDDDDLYDATPRAPARSADMLDNADDLDALIGEAEQADSHPLPPLRARPSNAESEEDDLDALIAEAEGLDHGGGKHSSIPPGDRQTNDFADEEAIMAEMAG